jgi:hypothetical protein
MLSGVEAGLNQAMDKLPDKVAEQVKGRLINRCGSSVVQVYAAGVLQRDSMQRPAVESKQAAGLHKQC